MQEMEVRVNLEGEVARQVELGEWVESDEAEADLAREEDARSGILPGSSPEGQAHYGAPRATQAQQAGPKPAPRPQALPQGSRGPSQQAQGQGSGVDWTWARGQQGDWLLRGPDGVAPGTQVYVSKRDGSRVPAVVGRRYSEVDHLPPRLPSMNP